MLAQDPPFWFYRKLKRSRAEKYPDSRKNCLHDKTVRIQKFSDSKFRIQNLRRHDQTGRVLCGIRPLFCKTNPVPKRSGFVTNPEQFPLV